jgi:hypothetical protein
MVIFNAEDAEGRRDHREGHVQDENLHHYQHSTFEVVICPNLLRILVRKFSGANGYEFPPLGSCII